MNSKISCSDAIPVLKDLIRINSVNPSLVPGGAGEKEIAQYLQRLFIREGIESEIQNVAPDRCNVLARVKGSHDGPRILWNGHLDTVGVAGMEAPFEPRAHGNRIYGRGSQDMKGGVAAAAMGLIALSRNLDCLNGEVIFAAVADEEDRSLGTQYFLKSLPGDQLVDLCIVLEPTELKVCTTHKGFAWVEVRTFGKAAHGSRPNEGVDAIRLMGKFLLQLDRLDDSLQSTPIDSLLTSGSLHASLIEGGREWSSYPDSCTLKYERRTVPPESAQTVQAEVNAIIRSLIDSNRNFRAEAQVICSRSPLQQDQSHPLVSLFRQCAIDHFPEHASWGTVSFWTDAALISEAGIPCVVFGPRGAGLHAIEEYVIASDVVACAELLYDYAISLKDYQTHCSPLISE